MAPKRQEAKLRRVVRVVRVPGSGSGCGTARLSEPSILLQIAYADNEHVQPPVRQSSNANVSREGGEIIDIYSSQLYSIVFRLTNVKRKRSGAARARGSKAWVPCHAMPRLTRQRP